MKCPATTRSCLAIWLSVFAALAVQAQERDSLPSDGELARRVSLEGLRVAATSAVAIVNGRLVQAGDHIDGIEVLAIDPDAVHLRSGGRSFSMRVGSNLIRPSRFDTMPAESTSIDANRPDFAAISQPEAVRPQRRSATGQPAPVTRYGPVAPGETLSEIAELLRTDGVERSTLMQELHAANPHSFGADENTLFAGTLLTVPVLPMESAHPMQRAPQELADAELRTDHRYQQESARATATAATTIKVSSGDTLSQIAMEVARMAGVTLHQAMSGIYTANPDAFGGDVNLLYAGAVLEIPTPLQLQARAPSSATARVQIAAAERALTVKNGY